MVKRWVSRFIIRAKKRPNIICQFSDFLDIIRRGETESTRLVVKNEFNMQKKKKKAKENWGERKREYFFFGFFHFLSAVLITWVSVVRPVKCILQMGWKKEDQERVRTLDV